MILKRTELRRTPNLLIKEEGVHAVLNGDLTIDTIYVSRTHFPESAELFIREVNSILKDYPSIKHIKTDFGYSTLSRVSELSGWLFSTSSNAGKNMPPTRPLRSFYVHHTLEKGEEDVYVSAINNIHVGHFEMNEELIKKFLTFKEPAKNFSKTKVDEEIFMFYDTEGILKETNFLISYDCMDDLKTPATYAAGPTLFSYNFDGTPYPFIERLDRRLLNQLNDQLIKCARLF